MGGSRTEEAGETGTRAGPGAPNRWGQRWLEFIQESDLGWANPDRLRSASKSRAKLLRENFLTRPSCRLAIEDG